MPRLFRTLPIGRKHAWISLAVPRVLCRRCGLLRQVQVGFAEETQTAILDIDSDGQVKSEAERRVEARMKGYEGENCGECGNFTMVRNWVGQTGDDEFYEDFTRLNNELANLQRKLG